MAVSTAGAIIGGSVISGALGAKAASKAGKAQEGAAAGSIEEQRRQFDLTQQNLQPFQQAGESALEQQRILLGLGGTDPNAALRADLQSQLSNIGTSQQTQAQFSQQEPLNAMQRSRLSPQESADFRASQQQVGTDFDAQRAGIQSQLDAIPVFNPGTNAEQQQSAFDKFNQSPGQQFLRDRAQKNLLRNSAAIGGLGGGNVRSALVQQGVGFAQQDFNNQFGRLGQLAGQGQNAATNVSQFGQQSANAIGNSLIAGGNARASGITNQSNAIQNAFGGALTGLGQSGAFSQPPSVQQGSFNQTGQFSGNINPFARTS